MWIWSLEEEETRDDEMKHIVFAGLFVCSAISFQSFVSHYDDIAGTSVLYPTEKNPPSLLCSEHKLLHLHCPFWFPVLHLELWFLCSL